MSVHYYQSYIIILFTAFTSITINYNKTAPQIGLLGDTQEKRRIIYIFSV